MLATSSKNFQASVSNHNWSPIVKVEGYFEKYNNNNCSNLWLSKDSVNWNTLSITHSIQEANYWCDWNNSLWWRIYTFKITYIEDEAWNIKSVSSGIKKADYNVYSNHNNITTKTFDSADISNLQDNNNIADWTPYKLKAYIKDTYWNWIVKSPWINRTIDFNFNVTNTLYLDQYTKTWDAVFVALPTKNSNSDYTNKLTNNNSFNNIISDAYSEWRYDFKFKVYTPTANIEPTATWNFKINSVSFDINSNLWNPTNALWNDDIEFKFKPLYKTTFNWEQANYWFIEWVVQNWNINIIDNSWEVTRNKKLYLEFGKWNRIPSDEVDMYTLNPDKQVIEWHQTNVTNLQDLIANYPNSVLLKTKIIQNPGKTLTNLQEYYLSTHFAYTIDGHNVVYNSSVLGRNNYFDGPPAVWNTTQSWLKVLWTTHSSKQKDIVTNQEVNDIHILWNLYKASIKKYIRKNIYKIINNISWGQWWDSNDIDDFSGLIWKSSHWKKIYNNKVLYFDLSWNSEKTIVTNWWSVEWKKTIVIKWGDLYIKWNIKYNSSNDILWIVVLKDENWKGWNLYIDPSVTYIAAQIYADKAILSAIDWYDWSTIDNEINSSEILSINTSQSRLNNQLYINW
jgi:hypothetical protein